MRLDASRILAACALFLCLAASAHDASTASAGGAATSSAPEVVAVGPGSGTGAGRTFLLVYANSDGASDIDVALVLIGTAVTGADACYIYASDNHFWLRDDTDGAWIGPVAAGSAGRLANGQCALTAAGSSMSRSGNRLTVTVTLTFTIPFAGTKSIYMNAIDRAGLSSGWLTGGTWTVTALNPALDVVTSSCSDPSKDAQFSIQAYEQGSLFERQVFTPVCFPRYTQYAAYEGMFLEDRRAIPVMGRTTGRFDVLVVFVDTALNRQRLFENSSIPPSVKAQISAGRIQDGLTELLASYTREDIMAGVWRDAASAVEFSFAVALTRLSRVDLELVDGGLGFAKYDAVLVLDELPGNAGWGVRRWPVYRRPVFYGKDGGFLLNIAPFWLTPGLLGNELMRRNLPTLLSEYQFGERTLVREGGNTYDRTPIINPRTGENLEPLLRPVNNQPRPMPIGAYLAGYGDVDRDGILDCFDPYIAPTVDNVDADFIPDRFDPDLRVNHRPYSWMYAVRSVSSGAIRH